jgi:hypothetical protein
MRRFMVHLVTEIDFVDGDEASDEAAQNYQKHLSDTVQNAAQGLSLRTVKDARVESCLGRRNQGRALAIYRSFRAQTTGRDHPLPARFSAWRRYHVRRDISSLSQGFLASMVLARSSMRGPPLLRGFISVLLVSILLKIFIHFLLKPFMIANPPFLHLWAHYPIVFLCYIWRVEIVPAVSCGAFSTPLKRDRINLSDTDPLI